MGRVLRSLTFVCLATVLGLFAGCGNGSSNTASTRTPAATGSSSGSGSTASSGTTGSASPGSGSSGSSGGSSSSGSGTSPASAAAAIDSVQEDLVPAQGFSVEPVGTLTLNASANNGSGTVQAKAENNPNETFTMYFLPFNHASQDAFLVGTIPDAAGGPLNGTFQFPNKGTFAGIFFIDLQVGTFNAGQYYFAGDDGSDPNLNYSAPLIPASTITGGVGGATGTENGSGRVEARGFNATISLAGGATAHAFTVQVCSAYQNCYPSLGTLTTDNDGNASGTFSLKGIGFPSATFVLRDAAGIEYISGFRVQ